MSNKKSALFICLGNICRSPIAESVFVHQLEEKGLTGSWKVDSAAIGSWHVGKRADPRTLRTLKKHGIASTHVVRQITKNDFNEFDYIFGMDEENMSALKGRAPPGSKAELLLLGSFDPQGDRIIRDPYYDDGDEGFEKCYQQCVRSCAAFLEQKGK